MRRRSKLKKYLNHEPWYDNSQDLDGSQALYEIAKKPVAIHLDLTPYRMHIQKNQINLENNFEKRLQILSL